LASWSLDNRLLDLDFQGSEDFEFSAFIESNEWTLSESAASKQTERYSCGHFETPVEFTQLVYSMTIRRCVGFYVYALIIPSVLLSFFMPLTFWIPTNGDGRLTLGSWFVFLLFPHRRRRRRKSRARAQYPLKLGKYFSDNYHVKFGHFPGKYHVICDNCS